LAENQQLVLAAFFWQHVQQSNTKIEAQCCEERCHCTQVRPKYRTTQLRQTHNPAVAAFLNEMYFFHFLPFPMQDCKIYMHAPMVQTHRHTMIKCAHHQGSVPVLQYGPFGLHGPLFGRVASKSKSKAGPTDHPLFCDKSHCLQQDIPSAPPNDPSSIFGHFAVRFIDEAPSHGSPIIALKSPRKTAEAPRCRRFENSNSRKPWI